MRNPIPRIVIGVLSIVMIGATISAEIEAYTEIAEGASISSSFFAGSMVVFSFFVTLLVIDTYCNPKWWN